MKYYSDKTKAFYSDVTACEKAEREYDAEQAKAKALAEKKASDRKDAAAKVEAARKAAVDANKAYREALNEFCRSYGTWHSSLQVNDVADLFDWFFI